MGGWFSGVYRWFMGRLGAVPAPSGGGVCATVTLAPRVNATATLAPRVNATVTVEAC
jgi:hypothetical protein